MPLIIVPTPVGNLEDMTLRGLCVLREADVIACEDTRHTLQLLNHFDIKKPLISCHEHNEVSRIDDIMARIEKGETVALVSDAGTPGLSDPGAAVIRAAMERGLPCDALPGANALLPALLMSGMGMERFFFAGFLKGRESEKKAQLEELKGIKEAVVFYIAPHRLIKETELIGSVFGDRRAALVKEISKVHQETILGSLLTFRDTLPEDKIRGEFVCVVEGNVRSGENVDAANWIEEAKKLCGSGESTKNVANLLAIKYGIPRNKIKKTILENFTEEAK
jgi:16S rRNA (cytidine1402-2'-O)-methyltransferase